MLICKHYVGDPLLKDLQTTVIVCLACERLEAPRDKKKKQHAPQEAPLFEVLLQDTILFPEGGGQPSDIGIIKGHDGVSWDVLEVKRRGGLAIHYVKGGETTIHSIAPGVRVTVSLGEAGFKRRYDHVRQ